MLGKEGKRTEIGMGNRNKNGNGNGREKKKSEHRRKREGGKEQRGELTLGIAETRLSR